MNNKYTKIFGLSLISLLIVVFVIKLLNYKTYASPFPTYISEATKLDERVCLRPPPRPEKLTLTISEEGEGKNTYKRNRTRQNRFEKNVARWVKNDSPACAYFWYAYWARNDAVSHLSVHDRGRAARTAFLSFASSHYSQINDLDLYKNSKGTIESWLEDIAEKVKNNNEIDPDISTYNNQYWTAWAVMATGIATNNKGLYNWSEKQFTKAVANINDKGQLPEETNESKKTYNHHIFSAGPLIMTAETMTLNGENGYDLSDRAIHKLVKRILDELDDGKIQLKQARDEAPYYQGAVTKNELAWLEVYHKRYPSTQTERWTKRLRPFYARHLGGDLTAFYAEK